MKTASHLMGLAGAALLAAGFSTSASAATTISGSVSNVSLRNTDPGLVVYANPLAFADIVLNSVGDSAFRHVLNIGTTENSIQPDDTVSYPISVTFAFALPAGTTGPAIGGSTDGYISLGCFFTHWDVDGCGVADFSSSPTVFSFGTGGSFSVQLFDGNFGTPGNTDIKAKFKLLSESSGNNQPAVPEPTTWAMMILGFGAIGLMMRRRRGGGAPARLRYGFKGLPQLA